MPASQPLAVLFLAAAVALLLAALANPAAAAVSGQYGGGRMVILRHAAGTSVAGGGGKWRYGRVEDEVAPEFGAMLATNSNGGRISTGALDKNRPGCQSSSQCAGKPAGGSYTRPCTYRNQCRGG
ncbi:unnamed protein product [Urochloa humidicola]